MRRLAQILREFNRMDVTIEKLAPKSGDVLFFKVGDQAHVQPAMIEAFLQHLHERGINDCMAMILGPNDTVEPLSKERLEELARAVGYVKSEREDDTRLFRHKGRLDVLRLLEAMASEIEEVKIEEAVGRIREAITKASSNGKEVPKPAETERPIEIPYS
jgi:ribosomal protein L12E/L44/L45/RPP1/RPP2